MPDYSSAIRIIIGQLGLPEPIGQGFGDESELEFAKQFLKRKWKFDYAWVEPKIALEVEGGNFTRGRHARGSGRRKDMLKYSVAGAMGWIVIYRAPEDILKGETFDLLRLAFETRGYTVRA